VQTRRLFSQLELLKGFIPGKKLKEARRSLKRHHKLFRDIRDAHVLIASGVDMRGGFPVAPAFGNWLRKREARASRKVPGALKRVRTKRLKKQIAAFERELRQRGKGTTQRRDTRKLRRAIDRAFDRVTQLDRSVDAADPKTIHRVRVALKRYFHMVDALPPGLSGVTERRRRDMRKSMSRMGKIQDMEVLLSALQAFEQEKETVDGYVRELRESLWSRRAELIQGYMVADRNISRFRPAR
jgi:CHAD domain-containing protein